MNFLNQVNCETKYTIPDYGDVDYDIIFPRLEEGEKSIVIQSFTEGGGEATFQWVWKRLAKGFFQQLWQKALVIQHCDYIPGTGTKFIKNTFLFNKLKSNKETNLF